ATAGRGVAGPDRDPVGDAVEPGSERVTLADGPGVLEQDEEGGLEGVVDVRGVGEDLAARGQDAAAVAADDRLERRRGVAGPAAVEEVRVPLVAEPGGRIGRLEQAGQPVELL